MASRSTPTSPSRRPTDGQRPPALIIRLARRADGGTVLELRRADGTTTWQRREGPTAEFFAVHDLTHYAVETTLGCAHGFYGLVATGWELGDFGHPWPRGPLPPEAVAVEVIVGCFDTHRAAHATVTASDCNAQSESWFAERGTTAPIRVTDADVDAIRARLSELVWRWHALPAGGEMELAFPG